MVRRIVICIRWCIRGSLLLDAGCWLWGGDSRESFQPPGLWGGVGILKTGTGMSAG